MARAVGVALCALALSAVGIAGCGEEEGVADGATVTAYVERPLCEGGSDQGGEVQATNGSYEILLVCLPASTDPRGEELSQGVGGPRRIDLATLGANARRATGDSTTVAYLQLDDRAVSRFTQPILEAAGIGLISADTRDQALRRLMQVLTESDPSALRDDVREALGQG